MVQRLQRAHQEALEEALDAGTHSQLSLLGSRFLEAEPLKMQQLHGGLTLQGNPV